MGFIELFLIAVGLSMDAFAVAVCKGLSLQKDKLKGILIVGLYFGFFQAVMPLIGYYLGTSFAGLIETYDHWIAFALLFLIGTKMAIDSVKENDGITKDSENDPLNAKKMLPLALATSIDALAIGISFAFLQVKITPAILLIGVTTCALSMLGVAIGHKFGSKFHAKAEFLGGCILVFMGIKIVLEHTGIL